MNALLYTAAKTELLNTTSASKAEELVRKYNRKMRQTELNYTYYSIDELSQSDIFFYKLYALALNTHAKWSKKILPNFLHESKTSSHRCLLQNILDNENPITVTYKEFMSIFEFDTIIDLPRDQNLLKP